MEVHVCYVGKLGGASVTQYREGGEKEKVVRSV